MSDPITEKRLDRIDDVIERLTNISADLNKMLAVQELRLTQQEKAVVNIEAIVEHRREEYDKKIQTVYDDMNTEDNHIVENLEKLRTELKEQNKGLSDKITELEKIMWMYLGGFSVIVFLITYGDKILKFFGK